MVKASDLTDTWNNIKEIDLRPIRELALNGVKIAIVGQAGSGRSTLADQMRCDPARPQMETDTPVLILDYTSASFAAKTDLIILMVDIRHADYSAEKNLLEEWSKTGNKVLIFENLFPALEGQEQAIITWRSLRTRRTVRGSVLDSDFLTREFAPAVIELLPDQTLGLGRYFPLFRVPVAHRLIYDTCISNAAYSLSTGLAEIVPIFDIPLNVTDMIVLTKTQAFLVYKLGLALGFSTRWQDYVAEFGSVLGSGFIWRQVARSLVGLIPVWGIVPKVAVAYSGTFVVGHVVLQWYLTGRHISTKQMRDLYRQAFERGKNIARSLSSRVKHPQLPNKSKPRLPRSKRRALLASESMQVCSACGRTSNADALFCQYCGEHFAGPQNNGTTQQNEMLPGENGIE